MVNVAVDIYKPFYDFMKEYLAFFGSKDSIEDLCRSMIYDDVQSLYEMLKSQPHVDDGDWFNKWSSIAITIPVPGDEES